jgi:predicted nucleic acid-binding protein
MLILDTNVISEVRKRKTCPPKVLAWLDTQLPSELYISSITVLEIQRGITQLEQRGDKVQSEIFTQWLEGKVLPSFSGRILPVDHLIARQAGCMKWPDSKDYRDSLIAATAVIHGLTVVTRNIRHFKDMDVPLLNPWEI